MTLVAEISEAVSETGGLLSVIANGRECCLLRAERTVNKARTTCGVLGHLRYADDIVDRAASRMNLRFCHGISLGSKLDFESPEENFP